MTDIETSFETLIERALAAPRSGRRRVIALAGAPASGKSTLADQLARSLTAAGSQTQVVPMDGFHLDNPVLIARGLLDRKGSPPTFDANGLAALVPRIKNEAEVFYPTFDRTRDLAIAGSGVVDAASDTVIVEGNYLLYDAPVWRELQTHWDLSVRLDVPDSLIHERLIARWLDHGLSHEAAEIRASQNDLPNARLLANHSLLADIVYRSV